MNRTRKSGFRIVAGPQSSITGLAVWALCLALLPATAGLAATDATAALSGAGAQGVWRTVSDVCIWVLYIGIFVFLARKGRGHDAAHSGAVPFTVQAFAYVATYISTVALVGFGGLAHAYGLQMLLVAAGNVWLGTWFVYRYLAWPTRGWQLKLEARSPAQLLGRGHYSPLFGRFLALLFAVFLGVYASAVIKGAALLLTEALGLPVWLLIWIFALIVGFCVCIGGLRGVLYTEAMQGAVMLVGIVLLVGAVFYRVGGPVQGIADLAALPPDALANNGFAALSSGEAGLFILSLVFVTSVAVWAQPQMIQRHFAISSLGQLRRTTVLAMLVLTLLVGGAYFASALSRLILPEVPNPDVAMPMLVKTLLPHAGMQVFVLAVVSASLSTATALYHIAAIAMAEDLPARKVTRGTWILAIGVCILISGGCAQIKGQLIALLCTTSWSIVGATVLVPYVALVRFEKRNAGAAWCSAIAGFVTCLGWYLLVYRSTALVEPVFVTGASIPPFFPGLSVSLLGWFLGYALLPRRQPGVA
ncbi:sodium:solute symporter family protein [Desulfovibrio sp. OttesenSCG-928-A18]|nr:sodium:solute symporter family protein [Desulfovibrio sp. OttesenSCG-928-A18]